jgi:hypothetical protein
VSIFHFIFQDLHDFINIESSFIKTANIIQIAAPPSLPQGGGEASPRPLSKERREKLPSSFGRRAGNGAA